MRGQWHSRLLALDSRRLARRRALQEAFESPEFVTCTNRDKWMKDKTSRLTPDAQVQRMPCSLHRLVTCSAENYRRAIGVGRGRGVGVDRGVSVAVAVGVTVAVAVAVGVNVAVAVGVGAGKQNISIELSGVTPSLA
jgi:hypothetical protein